jgi:hypothetical protein
MESMEDLFNLFTRHLVGVVLRYSIPGREEEGIFRYPFPGFLLQYSGRCFYLTAGHTLKKVEDAVAAGKMRIVGALLADYFAPDAEYKTPVPFDFANLTKPYLVEEKIGFDIGIFEIGPNTTRLMGKNKIIGMERDHWEGQDLKQYERFLVLGFPDSLHTSFPTDKTAFLHPRLVELSWIPDPSEDIVKGRKTLFCASAPEEAGSLEGMSGGPIFGVMHNPELQYQIVAIQVAQVQEQERRLAIGCVMPAVGWLVSRVVEESDKDAGPG